MKKLVFSFVFLFLAALGQITVQAQTTGSISGTVTDAQGAVVPGAAVTIKGEAGQQYNATTNSDGAYTVPGVQAGTFLYTVTITAQNFKTAVVRNVKVDTATPSTVNAKLEAGKIEETVVVTSGGEVLQTETATVGTTISGRQILETPIQSRDALDLVTLLPGTSTTGVVRTSSINGLPKSALTIQIDGVDVQDNYLKSSDGFFTFIRPRIDAIDEVTVSTASPGSESSGDGAVAIRFQTRRGTDEYRGSGFWQHRDEGLNTTNFQNNFLNQGRSKLRLNQFGASFSGPIPFLNFGEGVPWLSKGKGKRYFFINYERYHLNENSPVRTRQVLTAEAQSGIFRYGAGGASTVNLFNIAAAASPALPNTIDPTVAAMLNLIRTGTGIRGSFQPLGTGGVYFRQPFAFVNPGEQRRRFLVVRTDFNITKDHALDVIYNDQPFRSNVDFLNSVDPAFPGIPNAGTQSSDRRSLSIGFRSNFGGNLVNQFRYAQLAGWLKGGTSFDLVGGTDYFDNLMQGFAVSLANAGLTNPTVQNGPSSRTSPTMDFTNTLTWVKGDHTISVGGQLKRVETISDSFSLLRPTVTLGVVTGDPVLAAFTAATMPGANAAEIANAQNLYAVLTGRISAFGSNAILGPDGRYALNGPRHFEILENTNGLFAQDSWRIRPNLTLSYGVRWQPQTGAKLMSANYAVLSNPDMIYDVSGRGNLFTPGTLTGAVPTYRGTTIGEKAFRDDWNNWAPSVGAVWSPDFGSGVLGFIFGKNGTSVFRGGFSRAFIREGTFAVETSIGRNPGGTLSVARNTGTGNLTIGSLLRTPGNPNLVAPAFSPVPAYPLTIRTGTDVAFGFAPDFRSGYVDSWSFGFQRQLGADTVVEFRYVGNRGKEMQSQYNLNEINAIENGFGAEFAIAQRNLLSNIAAGPGAGCIGGVTTTNCQINFAFTGAPGTAPLPILVSYLQSGNPNPALPASYTAANFASSTYYNLLTPSNPNVLGFASAIANNATTRGNGATAGRAANFLQNCPSSTGLCFLFGNSEKSWFDSAVIEVRRRMSSGLRFQASYTFGKAFTNAFAAAGTAFFGLGAGDQGNVSNLTLRNPDLDRTFAQVDIRHSFKFDASWDLPFGKGRPLLSNANWFVDGVLGGWTLTPTLRWQSGSPVLMENINLVGMTGKELQKMVGVYYNQTITQPNGTTSVANVTYLPGEVISQTIRAFTTTGTTASGYLAGQAPSGQFIAPAGYGNCQQRAPGQCGFRKFVLYGPDFFKLDSSIGKRFKIGEKRNVEFRMTVFDVLNQTNWRIGAWTGNVNNVSVFTTNFGVLANGAVSGSTYQDPNGSNDPGGRIMDFLIRLNF